MTLQELRNTACEVHNDDPVCSAFHQAGKCASKASSQGRLSGKARQLASKPAADGSKQGHLVIHLRPVDSQLAGPLGARSTDGQGPLLPGLEGQGGPLEQLRQALEAACVLEHLHHCWLVRGAAGHLQTGMPGCHACCMKFWEDQLPALEIGEKNDNISVRDGAWAR